MLISSPVDLVEVRDWRLFLFCVFDAGVCKVSASARKLYFPLTVHSLFSCLPLLSIAILSLDFLLEFALLLYSFFLSSLLLCICPAAAHFLKMHRSKCEIYRMRHDCITYHTFNEPFHIIFWGWEQSLLCTWCRIMAARTEHFSVDVDGCCVKAE